MGTLIRWKFKCRNAGECELRILGAIQIVHNESKWQSLICIALSSFLPFVVTVVKLTVAYSLNANMFKNDPLHLFCRSSAYILLFDEKPCHVGSTRNKCCELCAYDVVYLQSFHYSKHQFVLPFVVLPNM